MYAASVEPGRVTLALSIDEVRWINNALNEVTHGLDIAEPAFVSRLGGSREELENLLHSVHTVLDSAETLQPKDR
jgi:hypothetical protein